MSQTLWADTFIFPRICAHYDSAVKQIILLQIIQKVTILSRYPVMR